MKLAPLNCSVTEMAGFNGMEPLVMVMKFVMATVPPEAIVKGATNGSAWAKDVTFVPPELTEVKAGLIETAAMAQPAEAVLVQEVVAEAAPSSVLPAPRMP